MKPFILDYAQQWIKDQTMTVTMYFTKQHHDIVKQFVAYKIRTCRDLAYAEEQKEYIKNLEQHLALKTPVMEAELAFDESSALSLYDCLIPKIKEHRMFHIPKKAEFQIDDFRAKLRLK